ncbi:ATP-binding response regulator [Hephaestia mangrovi]|uniref:ATP-binding response regulator n=1 Tax=Hephaestia mangrovi TaxID=2873268 RepID=UPI002107CD79|nr:ATP-binding protein [Hephaestia mangrovi]
MPDLIARKSPQGEPTTSAASRAGDRAVLAAIVVFVVIAALALYLAVPGDAVAPMRVGAAAAIVLLGGAVALLFTRANRRHRTAALRAEDRTEALTAEIAAQLASRSELERAQEAAEAANAAKTRYLVAVNHEIRSPLNAIYGYAQLLERDGTISAVEAGGVIRRSAEHLANLVESLLEISRIESGTVKLRSDVVQLPALLDDVVDMFRMQAKAKGIELRYEPAGRLPRFVRTDEKRLRQILINLLSNAIKYTIAGSVTLSVAYRSQVAEVAITDTGIGIAPEDLERIFEPFERGSSAEAALQPGVGLGLAITRMLARVLGGEITAASTPGIGSCFTLRLFLPEPASPPGDVATRSRITGYAGSRKTILVVDDQQSQTIVLENLLRPIGFDVFTASNGAEGLALAERCLPDLVLLDIQMPGISGWETATRLRAAYGDAIRIVMVSANAPEIHRYDEDAPPHDAFVSKPVDLEALLAVVGRVLRLDWETANDPPRRAVAAPPPPLPASADKWLTQLRRLAKVGHIRGVEATLSELEENVPESVGAVAAMRYHVNNFDLGSLMRMLDDGQLN